MSRALLDTSVFVGHESGRPLDAEAIPDEVAVSAITIGELRAGVLVAVSVAARDQRLRTLEAALGHEPIPVDERVATQWARLRVELRYAGRRMGVNDSWIAATAIAHDLPVVTQDDDFEGVPGLAVVRV